MAPAIMHPNRFPGGTMADRSIDEIQEQDAVKSLSPGRLNGANGSQGFSTAYGSYSLHCDEDGVMHVVVPGVYAVGRKQWIEAPHTIVASEERNSRHVLSLAAARIKDAITTDRPVVIYV